MIVIDLDCSIHLDRKLDLEVKARELAVRSKFFNYHFNEAPGASVQSFTLAAL